MRYFFLLLSCLALVACSSTKETNTAEKEAVVTTRVIEVTREIVVVVTATSTPFPTGTSTSLPTSTPPATATSTEVPPSATPTPTPEPQTYAENDINVRSGPGTNYTIVGALAAGDSVQPIARNDAGDWVQIALSDSQSGWVAGWLLIGAPSPESLSIASDIPTPPPPLPTTPAPQPSGDNSGSVLGAQVGQEIEINGWRFKVSSIHKRKAVYFYDSSHVAFGNFLIAIIDATNLQSGTDYFARNLYVAALDLSENKFYLSSATASSYAQWQYDGASSMYTYVNPGVFSRMAIVFDIPESTRGAMLTFGRDIDAMIPVINFDQMPLEN